MPILSLSLDWFSLLLHLVNPSPIIGSPIKCHFLNEVLSPPTSNQTSILSICYLGTMCFSLVPVLHRKSGHYPVASVALADSLPTPRFVSEAILAPLATS